MSIQPISQNHPTPACKFTPLNTSLFSCEHLCSQCGEGVLWLGLVSIVSLLDDA